jgi:hypothetical protein
VTGSALRILACRRQVRACAARAHAVKPHGPPLARPIARRIVLSRNGTNHRTAGLRKALATQPSLHDAAARRAAESSFEGDAAVRGARARDRRPPHAQGIANVAGHQGNITRKFDEARDGRRNVLWHVVGEVGVHWGLRWE